MRYLQRANTAFPVVLLGVSALAFAGPAEAVPCAGTFSFTGAIEMCTVATNGLYDITAIGAGGGDSPHNGHHSGGLGTKVTDTFDLRAGETLSIAVGDAGASGNYGSGGGGGGSFVVVVGPPEVALLIAGGGGGAAAFGNGGNGGDIATSGGGGGAGGAGGYNSGAGGGGGLSGNGGNGDPSFFNDPAGQGGAAFGRGAAGGRAGSSPDSGNGGFGGGGGGGYGADGGGGGGGGGFTGGDGGSGAGPLGGLGGTSFDASSSPTVVLGFEAGNGSVTFTPARIPVPEPAGLAVFATGVIGLLVLRRRRRTG